MTNVLLLELATWKRIRAGENVLILSTPSIRQALNGSSS